MLVAHTFQLCNFAIFQLKSILCLCERVVVVMGRNRNSIVTSLAAPSKKITSLQISFDDWQLYCTFHQSNSTRLFDKARIFKLVLVISFQRYLENLVVCSTCEIFYGKCE